MRLVGRFQQADMPPKTVLLNSVYNGLASAVIDELPLTT
jgi:hypothetical protein